MQLKNIGAGMPDGGLFTQDQFNKKTHNPKDISSPARGMVEIKGLAEAVDDTATGAQVDKYWTGYWLVLVTNYRGQLEARMRGYFDAAVPDTTIAAENPALMETGLRFAVSTVRATLIKRGFLAQNIVRYCYRPFDLRWLYLEPETKLPDKKRSDYFLQVFAGNHWLCAVQQNRKQYDKLLHILFQFSACHRAWRKLVSALPA
jgi:hypothetical protein